MDLAIRRILFPTDLSPAARQAQDYALALAEQFQATLYVLHAIESPAFPVHGSPDSSAVPDDVLPRLLAVKPSFQTSRKCILIRSPLL